MRWLRIFALAVPVSFFLFTTAVNSADIPPGFVIFSGVDAQHETQLKDLSPFWTPTKGQIAELERLIESFIKSHPAEDGRTVNLSEYGRQYYGVTRDGKKAIYLNAFCSPTILGEKKWKKEMVFVLDGGSCFFQVFYDPTEKAFSGLRYNGVA